MSSGKFTKSFRTMARLFLDAFFFAFAFTGFALAGGTISDSRSEYRPQSSALSTYADPKYSLVMKDIVLLVLSIVF